MDKLGLGYARARGAQPEDRLCSISGYGQTGPYVDRAGHDLNYIALAGVLAMSGPAGGAPAMPGVQIADLAGGALWGATAILAALVGRERTGKGAHLDISMTEGALALLAAELGNLDCGAQPTRGTETLNGGARVLRRLPHQGRSLPRGRRARAEVLDRAQPGDRPAARTSPSSSATPAEQAKMRAELAAIFATKTAAEWHAHLRRPRLLRRGRPRARRARGPSAAPRARGVLHDRRRRGRRPDPAGPHARRHARGAAPAAAPRRAHARGARASTASPTTRSPRWAEPARPEPVGAGPQGADDAASCGSARCLQAVPGAPSRRRQASRYAHGETSPPTVRRCIGLQASSRSRPR